MPSIREILAPSPGDASIRLYALIDAARIEEMTTELLLQRPGYRILFEGEEAWTLEEVAPYLVRLEEDASFQEWAFSHVYGQDGAVWVRSPLEIDALAEHFRRFLKVSREVEDPKTGRRMLQEGTLAFYDPRVLPVWLESTDAEEKVRFLSPFEKVYYEDMSDKSLLHFYGTQGEHDAIHVKGGGEA